MVNNIAYAELSIEELERLIGQASEEIEKRRLAEATRVREKINTLLNSSGLTLNEVFQEKAPRRGRKVPMKYENPDDLSQQWSGRGKMPVWLRKKVEAGADREDFLIKDATSDPEE